MILKPFGKRVTIRPIKEEETDGGVYVPDETKKRMSKGEVIGIGEEVKHVSVGDVIIFSPFHYDEVTEDLFVISEDDIWGVVN